MAESIREKLELDLQEIQAYRELDSAEFNFNGVILRNTGEYNLGSEDAYYEMDIEALEEALLLHSEDFQRKLKYINKRNKKYKSRLNKYGRKKITQSKLKKLNQCTWWVTYYNENEGYYERCYVSGRKRYAKYCSKRKVRHRNDFALKGNGYRKVYDYWWDVF